MATVRLRCYPGEEIVDLPPVCMKCGAPATVRKSRQFSWYPPWIAGFGIIPLVFIVLSLVLTKRQRVETTFCDRHKSYWWLFPTIMWLTILPLLGFTLLFFIAGSVLEDTSKRLSMLFIVCGVAALLFLLVVVIVGATLSSRRIRPKEITDRYIHLNGVCEEFVDAVEEEEEDLRRNFDREEEVKRRPKRSSGKDDPRYTR